MEKRIAELERLNVELQNCVAALEFRIAELERQGQHSRYYLSNEQRPLNYYTIQQRPIYSA